MGLIISNILNRLINGQQNIRILMIGLDGAGKTTILYKLKLGEIITTIPTIGFNVETVHYKQCTFTVWDIGGQHKIRRLWHHYYQNTKGLIFVIDSNDPQRIGEAQIELQNLLEEPTLKNIILLIYANKQDLPNALPLTELIKKMHLNRICSKHTWYIQSLCAIHGYGLYEGLDWLSNELTK